MAAPRPRIEMKDSGIKWVGHIPINWNKMKLKRLVNILNGFSFQSSFYSNEGVFVVRITNVEDGLLNMNNPRYYPLNRIGEYEHCLLQKKDILMTLTGNVGLVGIVTDDYPMCALNQRVGCIRVKSRYIYYKYLYHLFSTIQFVEIATLFSKGTVQLNMSTEWLLNEFVPLPKLYEQQVIANYLDNRCSQINKIIAEATASIEEYKDLKQAVIFEAVTKGLDKDVSKKDSGIDWLQCVPEHWNVRRIASIYDESKENGRDDLPILLVSIHTGISDREIDDDERDRKVIRSEDKTVYKVVHKNYLAYNMMRAWQGGFGASLVDGLVSPAYVVAKPKINVNSSYIENVLRTPNAIEHIRGLSYGVADFRLRLYWPYFKTIRVPLPPIEEQNRIVAYIQNQKMKIDTLISEKQALIEDLQAYKKSLIYEVVTGKRRVV